MTPTTRPVLPRLLGAATACYGTAALARPRLLAGPCGLTDSGGRVPDRVAVLVRAVAARDAISGVAMACAPTRSALTAALAVRVASDVADAVGFGIGLPAASARRNAAVVAGTWGAVCAASGLTLRRRKSRRKSRW
ncbi:MAG: hypothetical protein ACRDMV_09430 [Streptosporangiales bacterium]